ncbi:MAG: endolytic transglycosylase MltG [Solirubrobacteraceae bacterium]
MPEPAAGAAAEEEPWPLEPPLSPPPAPEPSIEEPVAGAAEPQSGTPQAPAPAQSAPTVPEAADPQAPVDPERQDSGGAERVGGYAISGLPPAEEAAAEPDRLPPAPPRVGSTEKPPMRRAFRRGHAGAAAGVAVSEPRRRGRARASRLAALVALAAVAVAVVLLVHSLNRSSGKPVAAIPVVKVLIPEGKTRVQIAQIAAADGLTGDYRRASRSSPLLNPIHYGAPAGTPDLEGFLFPATYDMDRGAPVGRLVEEQLTAFQENFGAEEVARARALGVTPYQLLTVASMVEREAQVPGDRAKIAAVIYNRLQAGMPLGIDASIYYAVELEKGIPTYTQELTEAQLHIDSPYNTRTHLGLPPTPISNPGAASIYAAAHPAHVPYLYYVAGADGCGEQVFSDTQAEFEANVAAYEAAKRKNGGHPPTCKHA